MYYNETQHYNVFEHNITNTHKQLINRLFHCRQHQ